MPEQCVCTWCGQLFTGKRGDALFCNQACKQKYWRWKHKLNLLRASILAEIDEINGYLEHARTEKEAANVLGEVADRLADFGFVSQPAQMEFPEASYSLTNEVAGKPL